MIQLHIVPAPIELLNRKMYIYKYGANLAAAYGNFIEFENVMKNK